MSLRIVFMGTPGFAVPSLERLIADGHSVIGVFTQPDRPKGRGGKVQMSEVKECALKHGIPVFQPVKMRLDGLEPLKELKPDLCVTAAFGQILSQEVLDVPPLGTVNVHASLLPRHRGSAPIQWAILSGDEVTGVTTMYTERGIDTGDMLLKRETQILPDDNAAALTERLSKLGAELLSETLARIENGDCPREKQNEADSSYDPMLKKEMGLLYFEEGARKCLNRVRAMNPWPCAYAQAQNCVLKVWQASEADVQHSAEPGTVLCADAKSGLVIAVADGAISLDEVQAPNAKRMPARAFLLGHPIETGRNISEVSI